MSYMLMTLYVESEHASLSLLTQIEEHKAHQAQAAAAGGRTDENPVFESDVDEPDTNTPAKT